MSDKVTEEDRRFLGAAIRLGRQALGTTWPNPAVGAIVVRDGKVVGRGLTQRGGRPHAEPLAIAAAGEFARGATLYVSLEPCNHHGRTPPCTEAILAAGIARVIVPRRDPDPRVSGTGLTRLAREGVVALCGACEAEAGLAHAGHATRVALGRPYVLLKLAISADDAIGRRGEGNIAISGERARRHAQALRSRYDAILVGSGTVATDDPALTCRLPGLESRSPIRVVLEGTTPLPPDRRIFTDGAAPTWIYTVDPRPTREQEENRLAIAGPDGRPDPAAVLNDLAKQGITSVLVEGGAALARSLVEADLVDAAMIVRSSEAVGGDIVPALAGLSPAAIEASDGFRRTDRRRFGDDMMTRYERRR